MPLDTLFGYVTVVLLVGAAVMFILVKPSKRLMVDVK
jgi:hypothetical protein